MIDCYTHNTVSLRIQPNGENRAGENFNLECIISGLDLISSAKVNLQWILSGSNVSTSSAIKVNTSTVSQLKFYPLQASHKGSVTCQATVEDITIMTTYMVIVNGDYS